MVNSLTALYAAYSVVWAGVFVYLVYLFMKQRSLNRSIEGLKLELSKHGK